MKSRTALGLFVGWCLLATAGCAACCIGGAGGAAGYEGYKHGYRVQSPIKDVKDGSATVQSPVTKQGTPAPAQSPVTKQESPK